MRRVHTVVSKRCGQSKKLLRRQTLASSKNVRKGGQLTIHHTDLVGQLNMKGGADESTVMDELKEKANKLGVPNAVSSMKLTVERDGKIYKGTDLPDSLDNDMPIKKKSTERILCDWVD